MSSMACLSCQWLSFTAFGNERGLRLPVIFNFSNGKSLHETEGMRCYMGIRTPWESEPQGNRLTRLGSVEAEQRHRQGNSKGCGGCLGNRLHQSTRVHLAVLT